MSMMMALSAVGELMGHEAPEKATLSSSDGSTEITFQFNPNTIRVTRARQWTDGSEFSQAFPSIKWNGASNDTLSFDIVLDESEKRLKGMAATAAALNPVVRLGPAASMLGLSNEASVMEKLDELGTLTTPVEDKNEKFWHPPTVKFVWADFSFYGVIKKCDTQITLFSAKGTPKRAKVSISILGRANFGGEIKLKKGKELDPLEKLSKKAGLKSLL